jgi:hypothetical protein
MKLPEYVSTAEVQRVCQELKLQDWTNLTDSTISLAEAHIIHQSLALDSSITVENFAQGLAVELEHGRQYPDTNVTNNHPLLTGKIVLAHFKESLDYYKRLEVAEIEGDLLKALVTGKTNKLEALYRKLLQARSELNQSEMQTLEK